MARRFNGTSDSITLSLGGTNFAFGPGTIAAVIRNSSISIQQAIFSAGVSNAARSELRINTSGQLVLQADANSVACTTITLPTNKWLLVAATKASGTQTPRMHLLDYLTRAWSHADGSTTMINGTAPVTSAAIGVGATGTNFYLADIAVIGAWNSVLTDPQIESLAADLTVSNWNAYATTRGMWILDPNPAVTVVDRSGNGANQSAISGTTTPLQEHPLMIAPRIREAFVG